MWRGNNAGIDHHILDNCAEILERLLDQRLLGYCRCGLLVLLGLNRCLRDVEASCGDWLAVLADEDVAVELGRLQIDQLDGLVEFALWKNCLDQLINVVEVLEAGALVTFHDSYRQVAVIE